MRIRLLLAGHSELLALLPSALILVLYWLVICQVSDAPDIYTAHPTVVTRGDFALFWVVGIACGTTLAWLDLPLVMHPFVGAVALVTRVGMIWVFQGVEAVTLSVVYFLFPFFAADYLALTVTGTCLFFIRQTSSTPRTEQAHDQPET